MSLIKSISIENFKAFGAEQRLPIKPLTFVYGANSSGKSSVIHSLLFARHALEEKNLDVHYTKVGGDSVDLGGFRQYVHKRLFENTVSFSVEFNSENLSGKLQEIFGSTDNIEMKISLGALFQKNESTPEKMVVRIRTYEIYCNSEILLRLRPRPNMSFRIDRFETKHPVFKNIIEALFLATLTTEKLTKVDYNAIETAVDEFISTTPFSSKGLLPTMPQMDAESTFKGPFTTSIGLALAYGLSSVSKSSRSEDLKNAVSTFFPKLFTDILQSLDDLLIDQLQQVFYLGPLRSYPPRHLAFAKENDANWYAGGGYAWDEVRKDAKLRERINQWLSADNRLQTRYKLRVRNLLTIDDLMSDYYSNVDDLEARFVSAREYEGTMFEGDLFGESIPALLESIRDKEGNLSDVQELNLVDMRSDTIVSHRDVGIGVSQVLPVLVSAYASKEKIIAIEQPEIHLHPALQADLSDVFIESALGKNKNRFIIESHSEHLLLRVMKRMRQTFNGDLPEGSLPVKPEDVMILFVEPDGSQSVIREMPLNERGELVKAWPGGFFEEGLREVF